MYDDEGFWNLSSFLALNFISEFYFLSCSACESASPGKLSKSLGIV